MDGFDRVPTKYWSWDIVEVIPAAAHDQVQPALRSKLLAHLITHGFVSRRASGEIVMQEAVAGCDTKFAL